MLLSDREGVLDDIGYIILQHPCETSVQTRIHTFEILKRDFLLENHLIERYNEVRIEESTMEDTKAHTSSDEFEVIQMLRVDTGVRVDLEGIVVVRGILEKTVEGVEHLVRKKEKEFSARNVISNTLGRAGKPAHLDRPP